MMTYTGIPIRCFITKPIKLMLCLGLCLSALSTISAQLRIQDNSYRLGLLDTDESLLHGISGDHNGALTLRTLSLYNGSLSQSANRVLIGSGAPGAVDFSLMDFPSILPIDTSIWQFNPDGSGQYMTVNSLSNMGMFNVANEGGIWGVSSASLGAETTLILGEMGDKNLIFRAPSGGTGIELFTSDGFLTGLNEDYRTGIKFFINDDFAIEGFIGLSEGGPQLDIESNDNLSLYAVNNMVLSSHRVEMSSYTSDINISVGSQGPRITTLNFTNFSTIPNGSLLTKQTNALEYSPYTFPLVLPSDTSIWQFNPDGTGQYGSISDLSSGSGGGNGLFDASNEGDTLRILNSSLGGETTIMLGDNNDKNLVFRGSKADGNKITILNANLQSGEGISSGMAGRDPFVSGLIIENPSEGLSAYFGISTGPELGIEAPEGMYIDSRGLELFGKNRFDIVASNQLRIITPNANGIGQYFSNIVDGAVLLKLSNDGNEYSPYALPIVVPSDTSIWLFNPDGSGQYKNTSDLGSNTNFANTNLSFEENRSHNLQGNDIAITNGTFFLEVSEGVFVKGAGEGIEIKANDAVTISGHDPKINAVSDLTLNSPKILLTQPLLSNPNSTSLLVRNATTGVIEQRDASTLTATPTNGITNINGSLGLGGLLDQSTEIDGQWNGLSFEQIGNFQIESNFGNFFFDEYVNFGASNTDISGISELKFTSPKIWLELSPSQNNTEDAILVRNATTGVIEQRDASTLTATPTNGITNINGSLGLGGLLNQSTNIDANSNMFALENAYEFQLMTVDNAGITANLDNLLLEAPADIEISTGGLQINAEIQLPQSPTQTTTEDAILVRNATTGVIEQRDAATLTPDLITLFANLPIYIRTRDAGNDASLPSGSLFKVGDGNDGTSTIHIKD